MRKFNSMSLGKLMSIALTAAVLGTAALPAQAEAGPARSMARRGTLDIEPIRLENLQQYAGRQVSMFFVAGRGRSWGRDGQTLKVRSLIQDPVTVRIGDDGVATFDAVEDVPVNRSLNNGVSFSFSHIVFAV